MKHFKKFLHNKRRTAALAGVFLFLLAAAFPEQIKAALGKAGYDPFVNEMAYTPDHSVSKKIAAEFLTYPLELVRWPVKQVLYFVEEHRITAKTRYIFERLAEHGIYPKLAFTHWGAEIDLPKALHISDKLPENFVTKAWVHYGAEAIFETGSKFGMAPLNGSGFHALGHVKYNYRPDEDFYGIGSDTSLGDEASYKIETTTYEANTGYTHGNGAGIDFHAAYRNINIANSRDKDDGKISEVFPNQRIAGSSGDDIVTVGTEVSWKPGKGENPMLSPTKVRFAADFNDGVHHSDARYFKFTGEASKSFELGSPRRVLAFHFYGEHNNRLPGHTIPFHQMAKLGGFGTYPHLSRTLRGFEENRFHGESAALFNLEYRYRIYQYRDWTFSHVLFFDDGQTFNGLDEFQFKDFRESYGTGFRLALKNLVLLDLEAAHGDEGTSFYIRNSQPF